MNIDLFQYMDYREYLRDVTQDLKSKKQFNLRAFAKGAGLKAPGYLKMVIEGRRNLTQETAQKFCRALHIQGRHRIYFEKLVFYNQTTNPDLKKKYFDQLMALRPRLAHFVLEKRHRRYLSRPYYVSIREMVSLKDFREDYKWMARRLLPPISPSEAKEAVQTLLELGLLRREATGKLAPTEHFLKTQDKNTELIEAYHYHEVMIDKARHALGMLSQKERSYYALTLPLPKELFEEIINDFYAFRDQVVNKVNQKAKDFDEVYQINFQFFPVTKKKKEDPS